MGLLQNQYVDKFPRRFAIRCPRLPMNPLQGSNVVKCQIPSVLMFRSASVKLPRELFRRLFLEDSVELKPGRTARLLKTPGSNAALFKMRNVTMSQERFKRLFMRRSVQLSMTKSVLQGLRTSVNLLWRRNAPLTPRPSVKLSPRHSVTPFKMRFAKTSPPSNVVWSLIDNALRFLSRNAGMFHVVSARLFPRKNALRFKRGSARLLRKRNARLLQGQSD